MDVEQAYNVWAGQYDSNDNKTRDLEAISLRETLGSIQFGSCLEIGCGTGKNTEWLILKTPQLTAVDLSDEMLSVAKQKISSGNVNFVRADINGVWAFAHRRYDVIIFSLVLEHIENLDAIFENVSTAIQPNGYVYIGELHPCKQYSGSKARFDTAAGQQVVTCFNHHVSDFTAAAHKYGFEIEQLKEYFDNGDRTHMPRILTLLFRNKKSK